MKTYNYILLDWDGNIAKTLDLWLDALRAVLHEEGFYPSDEEMARSFGKVEDYFTGLGIKDPVAVYDRVDKIGREKLPQVELYPSALEVLSYLKGLKKKTALITASNHANIMHTFDYYDMHRLFDVVIAREHVTKHKPDPEPLHIALEKLGGTTDEAIMIGDSDKDLGAAANAEVDSVLFYPPEHARFYNFEKLKRLNPTYVVEDFHLIKNIVQ